MKLKHSHQINRTYVVSYRIVQVQVQVQSAHIVFRIKLLFICSISPSLRPSSLYLVSKKQMKQFGC